ncbi:MAG: Ig-like domain-containing protein, partial [Bacteroidales bacterium]|nr:Ig-like domain-containing protein [Bacteroidales bacterium]
MIHTLAFADAQIIADHAIVNHFDDIPQQYIDSVKLMLVSISGESHSQAYRLGMDLLETIDNTYQVATYDLTAPPASTNQYLRIGRHLIMGEDYFFSQTKIAELKENISGQNSTGNPFHVMGFGWCWDMTNDNDPGGALDTVYQVHWAGRSMGGPDGNLRWGLDSADQVLTGNSVCMDTYLEAVESYILHCTENSFPTKWVFTTGPVDRHDGTENGFQREIKHDYIRAYVAEDTSRILFDYADILCWNNSGEQNLAEWNDEESIRSHAEIHPENMMDYNSSWDLITHTEDGDHIGEVGTVRLAKAMWWMLARMAGWDGEIPVTHIQLTAEEDSTELITGGELQYTATVLPEDATNQAVDWSVINGTGSARISSQGLLRGGLPGDVEVIAFAQDGSGVGDTLELTITEPLVPVTNITLTTAGGIIEIDAGTSLQCSTTVLPVDATNPVVGWSVVNGTGSASVSSGGLVSALTAGTVDVVATAEDGSWIADTVLLTILTAILVTDIEVSSAGGVTQMLLGEELQMSANVLPVDATNQQVAWSVINGTGSASISSGGLVSA